MLASVDATDNRDLVLRPGATALSSGSGRSPPVRCPAQIVTADLNGDGWDDLVVAQRRATAPFGLLQQRFRGRCDRADARFQIPVTLPVGLGVSDVTLADVDRDGRPDIVVTNKVSGEVGVLRNLGHGSLRPGLCRTAPATACTA